MTRNAQVRRRWAPTLVAALAGGLLLSGCGELSPGTAAEVGDTRISNAQVRDVAAAQCDLRDSLGEQQGAQATSRTRLTTSSLSLLMDSALAKQFAASKGVAVSPAITKAFLDQVEPLFEPLKAKPQADLTKAFEAWARSRSQLVQIGAAKTGQEPTQQNLEQLLNAGLSERAAWLKSSSPRIETDPRYSPGKDGFPGAGDGSVSEATSSYARSAAKAQLDPTFVASLPAGQKCG